MLHFENLWLFLPCFLLFLFSIFNADDDVIYSVLDRKPTPQESVRRFRFVFIKLFTSLYGGGVLAVFWSHEVLQEIFSVSLSGNLSLVLILINIGVFGLLLGILQNIVREVQGRKTHPLIDPVILRYVRDQWSGRYLDRR